MTFKEVTITKTEPLNNREVSTLVNHAMRFDSDIVIEQGSKKINCKSIMAVLCLNLRKDSKIIIIAKGVDETEALEDLLRVINNNFVV